MRIIPFRVLLGASAILIAATILMVAVPAGCDRFSIREKSESSGFNGSFEIEKSGLPVNWYIYYSPIRNGDAELSLDSMDAVEGRQSLKFIAHRGDARCGWTTAGLFQVRPAKAKTSYKVSFWLKNQGCRIRLVIDSETADSREPRAPIREIIDAEMTGDDTWREFVYTYTVPAHYSNIRFELNVLEPGTLWVDDVRIEPLPDE